MRIVRGLHPLAIGLVLVLVAVPGTAQDDTDPLDAIDAAIAYTAAELGRLDARATDSGHLAFDSANHGLVEVPIGAAARSAPLVRALRDAGIDVPELAAVAAHVPALWPAAVVLADVPPELTETSAVETWLNERFAHLQDDERAAAYGARRERLAAELEDLRRSREALAGRERPLTETTTGEQWCREHGLGETLRSEDRQRLLGSPIPPLETLPEWCREPLLEWLIELQGGAG